MFRLGSNTIGFEITHRVFGKQDRGISPKGASDQTSFLTAFFLLGQPDHFLCYELFSLNEVIFDEDTIFTLTGAHYRQMKLNEVSLDHATVYKANKGDKLTLKGLEKGFRIYLMAAKPNKNRLTRSSKPYESYFPKQPTTIRVIQGPEYEYLKEDFFEHNYQISSVSDLSGLRLSPSLKASKYDIITAPVTDGTVQLTHDGPIVLMRHRQSTGGYPRIFNVIEADMDRLAQYPHGSLIRFKLISHDDAVTALLEYEQRLRQLEKDLL